MALLPFSPAEFGGIALKLSGGISLRAAQFSLRSFEQLNFSGGLQPSRRRWRAASALKLLGGGLLHQLKLLGGSLLHL